MKVLHLLKKSRMTAQQTTTFQVSWPYDAYNPTVIVGMFHGCKASNGRAHFLDHSTSAQSPCKAAHVLRQEPGVPNYRTRE